MRKEPSGKEPRLEGKPCCSFESIAKQMPVVVFLFGDVRSCASTPFPGGFLKDFPLADD